MNQHKQSLLEAFAAIGVTITESDIPEILASGADRFLSPHLSPGIKEENFTSIYIILAEMKSNPKTK